MNYYEQMMTELSKNSQIKLNEGDYEQDGLFYCGKCKTAKQVQISNDFKPLCLCKCEADRIKKEEAERKAELRKQKNEANRRLYMRSGSYNNTFDKATDSKIIRAGKRYVEQFADNLKKNNGLYLFGGTGTGKTFVASCIGNALIDKGYHCELIKMSSVIEMCQQNFNHDVIADLNRATLLIIDDFGAERRTEYADEIVFNLIDDRMNIGKPVIITSNRNYNSPKDLHEQRIYSRLQAMCKFVEVKGEDKRTKRP